MMNQDLQHLRLLSIFYYVVGGLLALFACFPLIYLVLGVVFLVAPPPTATGPSAPPPPPPAAMGWFFIILGGGLSLLGWVGAVCLLVAGRFLGQCRHYIYCLVTGCAACLFNPFGTILGVFTIILLIRPSVKRLFETGGLLDEAEERDEAPLDYDDPITRDSYNIRGER